MGMGGIIISSDYEKDMESEWAIEGLKREVEKAKDRQKAREDLTRFLEGHPDFKTFYLLVKAVEKY